MHGFKQRELNAFRLDGWTAALKAAMDKQCCDEFRWTKPDKQARNEPKGQSCRRVHTATPPQVTLFKDRSQNRQ